MIQVSYLVHPVSSCIKFAILETVAMSATTTTIHWRIRRRARSISPNGWNGFLVVLVTHSIMPKVD